MADNEKQDKPELDPRIPEAKKRLEECIERESWLRGKCLDDLEFLSGSPDEPEKQWGTRAVNERFRDGRPALVVNRLDQFVQHITNQQRQNRISAKVFPVDDQGDIDTAEVIQGMLRNIEYSSRGDIAYDTAEFYAVAMGFGFWILSTDYESPFTTNQVVKIDTVKNPFQVYLGPHEMPDGSDAEYGFKVTDLTEDEYEAEYGSAEGVAGFDAVRGLGDSEWCSEDKIRIVEYRYTEYADDTVLKLKNGSEGLKSQISDKQYERLKKRKAIVLERATKIPTIKWCKLTAADVLDETELPFNGIGIVKVTGSELTVNGKTILKGIVRGMKDAQRQYNFMLTAQTEAAADTGAVITVEGQTEGHEEAWATRLRKNPSNLDVKGVSISGAPAPNPTRLAPDPTIQAKSEARMMAAEDLKALTGIYDASLGQRSNETSGRAILSRQQQSDVANFHFQDNLTRSVSHSTRMIVNGMQVVYSGPRVARTIGEDDAHKVVKLNQMFEEDGEQKIHDLSVGKYDVICTAGPTFASKRQEAAALSMELARSAPILWNAAPDLMVKTIDMPYAQEISDRLKKTLPPNLQDKQDGQPEVPPEIQQQMQQYGQTIDMLTQHLNAANDELQGRKMEIESAEKIKGMEFAHKERIAAMSQSSDALQTHAKTDSAEAIAAFNGEVQLVLKNIDAKLAQLGHEAALAAKQMEGGEDDSSGTGGTASDASA
jgi:hypothetical protein